MTVLIAEGVWKSYPRWRPGTRSVRSMLSPSLRQGRHSRETRWALSDVSFSLEPGEGLGVIGHNGAGKSTLLRLASGISRPTRGSLRVTPSTASVLSLGDTFNADLSGASNAITAAVIGGLSPAEARAQLPRAIEFAELEEFQETPVRAYSDGMKLRLAFGVMTLLEPDLLIVDEVLAVGDLAFQEKCMTHLDRLRDRGTAIVMASHDLEQIEAQCERTLLLEAGSAVAYGPSVDVITTYREQSRVRTLSLTPEPSLSGRNNRLQFQTTRFGSQDLQIDTVTISSDDAPSAGQIRVGADLHVDVTLKPTDTVQPVIVAVAIERADDEVKCIDINSDDDELSITTRPGIATAVSLSLGSLELLPGKYWVDVGVFPPDWSHAYDYHYHVYGLTILGERGDEDDPVFRPSNRRWQDRSGT